MVKRRSQNKNRKGPKPKSLKKFAELQKKLGRTPLRSEFDAFLRGEL